jgi:hypothetical protein
METNLRNFIRDYKKYMDQECYVTKNGTIIGVWLPYDIAKQLEAEESEAEA